MGGGGSKIDIRFPTVIEDPYPVTESLDGISIAGSLDGSGGVIEVNQNISTSSVRLRREYGTTTVEECGRLGNDIQRVKNRQMAFNEFKTNLQNAKYLRPGASLSGGPTLRFGNRISGPESQAGQGVGRRFCERVSFNDQDAANIKNIGDYESNQDKLQVLRIQEVSARAYSSDTKLHITPSIPLVLRISGEEVPINRITLYHPCPVRVENKQYDAVISLNDPIDNPKMVVLIPVEGVLVGGGKSAQFFSRLVSYIPGILMPNANGEYEAIDAPTGSDWSLTNIFETRIKNNMNQVADGFFAWVGQPTYEQYISEDTSEVRRYSWRPSGVRPPTYVLMEKPIKVSSMDLMTLRRLPITPPREAIHPIPKMTYYRPYQCPSKERKSTREKFTTDECDPFNNLPPSKASAFNMDMLISILIGLVSFLALAAGIYFGLKYGTEPSGEFFKKIGGRIGQAISGAQNKVLKAVAARAAVIEAKRKETESKKAEESLKPKESGEVKKDELKKDEEFAFKNPLAERRKTARKLPETKEKPKDTTGVIKEDELRPGEEFAFKNPLADRRKTARVQKFEKAVEQAEKKVDEIDNRKKELKASMSDTSLPESEQRRIRSEYQKLTGEYIPTKQEQEEAAGVGTLKPKKRIIQSSDRDLTGEQKAQADLAQKEFEKEQKIRELDTELEKALGPSKDPIGRKPAKPPTPPKLARSLGNRKLRSANPPSLGEIRRQGAMIRSGDTSMQSQLRTLKQKHNLGARRKTK
jgi:hypothetical protein